MATFSKQDSFIAGNKRRVIGTLTLGTYATGGEAVTASLFGLRNLSNLYFSGPAAKSDRTDAVFPTYVRSTGKIAVYRQKDPAATGGADIALPEVANSTSLSSYSVEIEAVGNG